MTNKLYLRAWDGREMYYSNECNFFLYPDGKIDIIPFLAENAIEIDNPEHIMQGIEIDGKVYYEEDIIQINSDGMKPWIAQIIFKKGAFRDSYYHYTLNDIKPYQIKHLGNIFENPDLVKDSK